MDGWMEWGMGNVLLTFGSCSQHFLMRSAKAGGQLLGRVGRYRGNINMLKKMFLIDIMEVPYIAPLTRKFY